MRLLPSPAFLRTLPVALLASCASSVTAVPGSGEAVATPPAPAACVDAPAQPCEGCSGGEPGGSTSELAMQAFVDDPDPGEPAAAAASRDALQRCQRAEELLEAGDTAGALAEIDAAYEALLAAPSGAGGDSEQAAQDIRMLVARLIQRVYGVAPEADEVHHTAPWDLGLAMADTNNHVEREIRSMTTVEREQFIEGYRRSAMYRPMILRQLEEAGLPSQLSWLPLVESWFKVKALSRASALGMWQFISSTGLRYGLKRDRWIDERLDPEKSTVAAIAYLSDLHQMFGDWPKALAAYNCGEGRIKRLQLRSEDQFMGFWDLYELLPDETRRYVPRLIAAVQIIEDPAKYGMELPELEPAAGELATIELGRPVLLSALDHTLKLPPGTLGLLNPELRHVATPDHAYLLRVPAEQAEALAEALETLPKWEPPKIEYVIHRVRSGDTLSGIAERYRTSIAAIMRTNQLRSANRIWPGQRLRVPVRN